MKNPRIFILASLICLLAIPAQADAQGRTKKEEMENWRQKVQAEKVAFVTSFAELTVEEAEAFWPIYNEIEKNRNNAHKKERQAFRALGKAINENNDAQISERLQDYIAAMDNNKISMKADFEALKKVLPEKKVAKVMIAEETFRHKQIRRLHKKGSQK